MKIHAIRTGSVRIKTAQIEAHRSGMLAKIDIFADPNLAISAIRMDSYDLVHPIDDRSVRISYHTGLIGAGMPDLALQFFWPKYT